MVTLNKPATSPFEKKFDVNLTWCSIYEIKSPMLSTFSAEKIKATNNWGLGVHKYIEINLLKMHQTILQWNT